jgi:hypothetical protein
MCQECGKQFKHVVVFRCIACMDAYCSQPCAERAGQVGTHYKTKELIVVCDICDED